LCFLAIYLDSQQHYLIFQPVSFLFVILVTTAEIDSVVFCHPLDGRTNFIHNTYVMLRHQQKHPHVVDAFGPTWKWVLYEADSSVPNLKVKVSSNTESMHGLQGYHPQTSNGDSAGGLLLVKPFMQEQGKMLEWRGEGSKHTAGRCHACRFVLVQ